MKVLLLFAFLISSLCAQENAKPEVESGIALFDDWITSQIQNRQIEGASVAIVHKNQIVWKKAYGKASLTPTQPMACDTLFLVGGLTKPFTAAAIMKLWQEGKIDLDASLASYLPGFAIQGYHPAKLPITIRQLLNHTSGMPQDAIFPYWNDLEFPLFPAIWQTVKEQKLVYQPGTTWKYSHLGYVLLGKVIEGVSGKSCSDYIQQNFLDPLAMSSTTFRVQKNSKLSSGFTGASRGQKIIPNYDVKGMKAALGIYSNVEDMSKMASLFLSQDDPESILQRSTRRYMTASSVAVSPDMGYGLGFAIRRHKNTILVEHPGTMPGASCYLSMSPKSGCAVVIMCNSEEWLVPWVNEASRWVFSAVNDSESQEGVGSSVPEEWLKYRGKYTNREHDVYVEVYKGRLVLYEPLFMNELDTLEPQGGANFRIVQGYTFGSTNGDEVTFHLRSDGTVAYMKIANIYLTRVY